MTDLVHHKAGHSSEPDSAPYDVADERQNSSASQPNDPVWISFKAGSTPVVITKRVFLVVLISSLGYFVDVMDLLMFSVLRKPSLLSLGVPETKLVSVGVALLNTQMAGMITGGIVFGVLGDRLGRVKVLFASILTYSVANILNAFVRSVPAYGLWRFVAGFGLSGELGAAVTLVSETMPKETRGIGTTIVSAFGVLGACFAGLIAPAINWRVAYIVGGILGLFLLAMRVGVLESGMFAKIADSAHARGDLRMLIKPTQRLIKFVRVCLLGVANWFCIGVLISFSPELSSDMGVRGTIKAGYAVLWMYLGLCVGDGLSGTISQYMRSRKIVLRAFIAISAAVSGIYLVQHKPTTAAFYCSCFFVGVFSGYWVLFVQVAAESFGLNLRATTTTAAPNLVRGSAILFTSLFNWMSPGLGHRWAAAITGILAYTIALVALHGVEETFGRDLEFVENMPTDEDLLLSPHGGIDSHAPVAKGSMPSLSAAGDILSKSPLRGGWVAREQDGRGHMEGGELELGNVKGGIFRPSAHATARLPAEESSLAGPTLPVSSAGALDSQAPPSPPPRIDP